MDNENKRNWTTGEATQLMRIADALEEVLRLVKLDQEKMAKRFPDEDKE
jgi:ABC-type proline/glycine betaine transport system ATPase subunit